MDALATLMRPCGGERSTFCDTSRLIFGPWKDAACAGVIGALAPCKRQNSLAETRHWRRSPRKTYCFWKELADMTGVLQH